MPHPSLCGWLNRFTFRAPERLAIIDEHDPPKLDGDTVFNICRDAYGLGGESLMLTAGPRRAPRATGP